MSRASQLASLAQALQLRLEALHDGMDPSWRAPLGLAQSVHDWDQGAVGQRMSIALYERSCGPLPPLPSLDHPASRLALMDRPQMLARLCALALLGRPGVLRCCVERSSRAALQQCLGPAYGALRGLQEGTPVPGDVAAWSPLAWAWVGYRELMREGVWPDRGLRRLARLSLPLSREEEPCARNVPAALSPVHARLERLESLFESAPC